MDAATKNIRKNILKIASHSGHGHIPTCFSIVELLYSVYSTMNHSPKEPESCERDIFILSKGHAALALYCTLAEFDYFSIEEVYNFGAFGSKFGCHADRLKIPGVELSTGSLGHGIGVAVGIALALKIQKSNRKAYVVIGDGESNEGAVWEAIMVASKQKLDNLTILFDDNKSQIRCLPITDPVEKFSSFGCNVIEADGHDLSSLREALAIETKEKPKVIVANTQKGYGCDVLVNDMFAWHRRSPNNEELAILLEKL